MCYVLIFQPDFTMRTNILGYRFTDHLFGGNCYNIKHNETLSLNDISLLLSLTHVCVVTYHTMCNALQCRQ